MNKHNFHVCKSLTFYTYLHQIHQKISPCLMEWNSQEQKFEVADYYKNRKLSPFISFWSYNSFVVALIFAVGCCIDEVRYWDTGEDFKVSPVYALAYAIISIAYWPNTYVILRHHNQLVEGLELLQNLRLDLDRLKPRVFSRVTPHPAYYWKFLVCVINSLSIFVLIVPFTFTPALIYLKLDPFYNAFGRFFSNHSICSIDDSKCVEIFSTIIFCFRCYLFFTCLAEAGRFIGFILTLFVYVFELYITSLEILSELVPWKSRLTSTQKLADFRKFLKWYDAFRVGMRSFEDPFSTLFMILITAGYWSCVILISISIMLYDSMPLLAYLYMPTTAAVCTGFSFILLHSYQEVKTMSDGICENIRLIHGDVRKSRIILSKHIVEWKAIRKKVSMLRPVAAMCGSAYEITKDFEVDYYYNVFLKITDAVLLPIW